MQRFAGMLTLVLAGLVLPGCGGGDTSPRPVVKRSGGGAKTTPKTVKKPAEDGKPKKPD